jgi:transposase
MSVAVPLRDDFTADDLRRLAKASRDAGQSRRLLALAEIYEDGSRTDAARIGAVGLQTVRDWVLAFNASGPAGLIDRKAPGKVPKLDAAQRQALARVIEEGPDPERHGVVRWRLKDLAAWIDASFGVSLDESTVGRTVRRLGFRKLSARPRHHEQDPAALTAFKKPAHRRDGDPRRPAARHGHRAVVAGGPRRSEEHPAAPMGAPRQLAHSAQGSAHGVRLHLRGDLSREGQRRRPRHAALRQRSDEPAPG